MYYNEFFQDAKSKIYHIYIEFFRFWGKRLDERPPGEGMIHFLPGHARASVNTWRGLFEPSVNTYLEGDVKSIAVRKVLKYST